MAVSSMTEDDSTRLSAGRRLPHPLALAWFALFALLLAAVGFVALFGKATDGGPIARLDAANPDRAGGQAGEASARQTCRPSPGRPADLVRRRHQTSGAATAQVPAAERAGCRKAAPEPTLPPKLVPETDHQARLCRQGAGRRSGADRDRHRTARCRASPMTGARPWRPMRRRFRRRPQGPQEDRHRRHRAGHQRAGDAGGARRAAARRDAGFRALCRRCAALGQRGAQAAAMRCCSKCRWSPMISPTAIRARTRCGRC